jgi:hypothetical protein
MSLVRGLTTLRTDRKPRKFSSAREKREYLEYRAWQEELQASLKPAPKQPARLRADYSHVRETPVIPSRMETDLAVSPRKESRVYDGERKLLGIATMHKSSMVPVFDAEHAKDISRMRRG